MRYTTQVFQSFSNAFKGLKAAFQRDFSFQAEIMASPVLIIFAFLFWPLKAYELMFLMLGFCLMLIAELLNTALERVLERIHPENNELIGMSKDIASAAVLVALFFLCFVVIIIAFSHLDVS